MLANNKKVLKYIDFGLAKELDDGLDTPVGSPRYKAPELLDLSVKRKYTEAADIW